MSAIRYAAAGRMLLRRSPVRPPPIRRAAGVGERGVLQHPMGMGALSPSSNRYISFYFTEYDRKKLAVDLMKERSADNEIENLDELLRLLNDSDVCSDERTMQAVAARSAVENKKHELVSLLLRGDGDQEYKKKMEELAVVARRHRESLVLEDLKGKYKSVDELQYKMMVGIWLWGVPLTLITMLAR